MIHKTKLVYKEQKIIIDLIMNNKSFCGNIIKDNNCALKEIIFV